MEGMELPVDLVDYVQSMLSERIPLKKIAAALNISDPRRLKRLMTKALGQNLEYSTSSQLKSSSTKSKLSSLFESMEPRESSLGTFTCKASEKEHCKSIASIIRSSL